VIDEDDSAAGSDSAQHRNVSTVATNPARERIMLGYFIFVAVAGSALLTWAAGRPHATADDEEQANSAPVAAALAPGAATAHFPTIEIAKFRTIAQDTLTKVQAGDQAAATARSKDLETAWDDDEETLRPMDEPGWHALDGQIDNVLQALRASHPDPATATQTITALLDALH
jgi:hypothetical protein